MDSAFQQAPKPFELCISDVDVILWEAPRVSSQINPRENEIMEKMGQENLHRYLPQYFCKNEYTIFLGI